MACECCTGKCVCKATDWQLLENGTKVDGDVIITFPTVFGAAQVMLNAGGTSWYPYWYEATGAITYKLEIKCNGNWVEIDTWDRNLELCQGYNARWFDLLFKYPYDLSELAPDCGDCRDDTTGEPRDPIIKCLLYSGTYTKDKMRGWNATIFLGTDDDEWTNTNNWLDYRSRTPAARFPAVGGVVYIFGDALKNSFDDQPALGLISVGDPQWAVEGGNPTNPDGNVGIALIGTANFYHESELLETGNCGRVPDMVTPYAGGHIVGTCNFYNNSKLAGQVVGSVTMHNWADITAPGEVYGPCIFEDTSIHHGYIEGTADFYDLSRCVAGKVCGNVIMHDLSVFGVLTGGGAFVQCDVAMSPAITCAYDLTLLDSSSSTGAIVCQDVYVVGPLESCFAKNCTVGRDFFMSGGHTEGYIDVTEHVVATGGYFGGAGKIESAPGEPGESFLNFFASLTDSTISGPSWGTDSTVTTIYGDVKLSNSHNYGVIWGWAVFSNGSVNEYLGIVRGAVEFWTGSVNNGTVCVDDGNAIFVGAGSNNNGTVEEGTVGDAFTGVFQGGAINYGTVKGTARFDGLGSGNRGHVEGDATFTSGAVNYGTCEANATFMGAANAYEGVVQGNATLTNGSSNSGTIEGNATLTDGSGNGGTIEGNGVFTDSTNGGSVLGTATFNVTGGVIGGGTVGGLATFNGDTINGGVLVNAIFNGYSHNEASVGGDATFNNNAYNNAIVTGVATFNNDSHNDAATSLGTAIFNGDSINNGSATVATFNGDSVNNANAAVGRSVGTATFNANSINNGEVSGAATFNGDSINNVMISGAATFNGNSDNRGSLFGVGVFNGNSTNTHYVLNNATFNGTSINNGFVTGTATFYDSSSNYGGANAVVCHTSGTCTDYP